MGSYLNPGCKGFEESLNSAIYVDKTGLIEKVNAVVDTRQKYICVSRPRRFGKSMATDMLAAYYDQSVDTARLFDTLQIAKAETYQKYRNQYDVLKVNMQEFLSMTHSMDEMLAVFQKRMIADLKRGYPDYVMDGEDSLVFAMKDVYAHTKCPFIILIDEWDCLFREYKQDKEAQKKYLDFLRVWMKDQEYVALAYMTGILPIKKLKTQSALNNFTQFTMLNAGPLTPYIGFNEDEVIDLCEKYEIDFAEVRRWYDGYRLGDYHVYNPNALVNLTIMRTFQSYWSQTGTYLSILPLINMDFDGLRTSIIEMLSGSSVEVNVNEFQNDMVSFADKDDVLTLLIHLGYLAYDQRTQRAYIPNEEIRQEFRAATKRNKWNELIEFQQESEKLLEATWEMDAETVAEQIEKIHAEYTSVIQYNNENSLSSVLSIAYLSAIKYYFKPIRELPTGRGFADFVFIPKPLYRDYYPALLVELKWNKDAETALNQIKERKYPESLQQYTGDILLVGINYDKKEKVHRCVIEKWFPLCI